MAKRGGKRQGTPGKAYMNRLDLANNYRPQDVTATAAAGPFSQTPGPSNVAPTDQGGRAPQPAPQSWVLPDDIPSLTDPTAMPDQDPLAGLGERPTLPQPDYVNRLYAAYNLNPTPQLRNALNYLAAQEI